MPNSKNAALVYLVSFIAAYTVFFALAAFMDVPVLLNYAVVQAANICAVLGYCILKKRSPNCLLSTNDNPLSAPKAAYSAGAALGLLAQNLLIVFVFARLMSLLGVSLQVALPPLDGAWAVLATVAVVCVLPAVGEELLFRGVFVTALKARGEHYAVVVSAAVFALMHFNPAQLIHQFIIGLLLAYVYVRTGKLLYCMIIHFVNNLTAVLIEAYLPQVNALAGLTAPSVLVLLSATVGGAILLVSFVSLLVRGAPSLKKQKGLIRILAADAPTLSLVLALVVMSIITLLV